MSYGFLTESIEVLQARVEGGSKLPEIYTTLGDRYLEAVPFFSKLATDKMEMGEFKIKAWLGYSSWI